MEFNIRKKRQGDTSSVSSAGAKAEQKTRSAGVQFNIRKAETSRQSPARKPGGDIIKQSPSPALPASGSRNAAQARSGKSRGEYDSSVRSRYTQQEAQRRIARLKEEKSRLEAGLDLTGAAQVQERIDNIRRTAAQKKVQDFAAQRAVAAPDYQTSKDAQFDMDALKQSRRSGAACWETGKRLARTRPKSGSWA